MLQSSTLKFLKDLSKNNDRSWFESHRKQYDDAKTDFEDFIQSVINRHSKKDEDLKEQIAKQCIFRINRDIRFSKDKSPYKTNMGASMSRGGKKIYVCRVLLSFGARQKFYWRGIMDAGT